MPAELPVRIIRLEALVQGIVVGVLAGLAVFVATNWLRLKGGAVVGPHLALLGQFLPGYDVTFTGSLVGLVWGFAGGFVAAYTVSSLYNWIVLRRAARSTP
ncbi:MAG TPA: hypothetical protein VKA21_13685 [Candidatus Binatia bacterium]|nr:hypothetical protein [Candidatus Binatia bacterium]